jgi:hypothetical protein
VSKLAPYIQNLQSLDKLYPLIIQAAHKAFHGRGQVQLLQCSIGYQFPKARVGIALHKLKCIGKANMTQNI